MTRIGLISDTHNFLDENIFEYFKQCDEIWHAGDFGTIEIADKLITGVQTLKTAMNNDQPGDKIILRGVYGNIDGGDVRAAYTEKLHFNCEKVKVFMKHIGGYPNRYAPGVKKEIQDHGSGLFISGHSHILKVMYDEKIQCLHMNPGAAGRQGWHTVRTIIRFVIDGSDIRDCEVIQL